MSSSEHDGKGVGQTLNVTPGCDFIILVASLKGEELREGRETGHTTLSWGPVNEFEFNTEGACNWF